MNALAIFGRQTSFLLVNKIRIHYQSFQWIEDDKDL